MTDEVKENPQDATQPPAEKADGNVYFTQVKHNLIKEGRRIRTNPVLGRRTRPR